MVRMLPRTFFPSMKFKINRDLRVPFSHSDWLIKLSASVTIAVIMVEPADKISFVYNCMQTRLRGKKMGNDPLASFVCQDRW